MRPNEEHRKEARECLWKALEAPTESDRIAWLKRAEKLIRREQKDAETPQH
jgi:hypothetical protein